MRKKSGFILVETAIIVLLVGFVALSISTLIYNNNKNMMTIKSYIEMDEIVHNEAYRAKAGLQSESYEDIIIEKSNYFVRDAMGISGLSLEYIDIIVRDKNNEVTRTLSVLRGK